MAQQITNFFPPRGSRSSVTMSPVKPRSSSSSTPGANGALKIISNNRNYPMTRDIAPSHSPTMRDLSVFCDSKPRKGSDNENSDALCSSQESNNSSGSTSGSRKSRKASTAKTSKTQQARGTNSFKFKDEEVQTDVAWDQFQDILKREVGPLDESTDLPREALDLLADEPSETYYKDLAEARREALAEALDENQSLHELNELLHGEKDQLSQDFLKISSAHDSLKEQLAKMSQLNETLEEENRLLKEAMGLDVPEDDQ